MTIDKQALREVAEKVNSGEWSYEEFNRMDLPGGAHININGRDAIYCLKKPVGGVEQSRAVTAFIAAFNPKVALALLDERERNQQYIKLRDQENEDIALTVGKLRVELEHYKSREERVTKLVLDNSTSWDVLYEKLEAAERRIAELEAREVTLPAEKFCPSEYAGSQYWEETEVWNKAISACAVAVRAAGIKVKGE
ncbi:ead/Ea22-like family protein [Salmonella enterica]|nr:ead/Ea22-like family protein [Salmonella enterica]